MDRFPFQASVVEWVFGYCIIIEFMIVICNAATIETAIFANCVTYFVFCKKPFCMFYMQIWKTQYVPCLREYKIEFNVIYTREANPHTLPFLFCYVVKTESLVLLCIIDTKLISISFSALAANSIGRRSRRTVLYLSSLWVKIQHSGCPCGLEVRLQLLLSDNKAEEWP